MKKTFTLNNGVEIPAIGYGTWQTRDGEGAVEAVEAAIKAGYRHIDSAACYHNEKSVGEAIKNSGVDRSELFITTKVWNPDRGYENTKKAFEASMEKLGLDYLDLYLIHWPANAKQFDNWDEINLETWRAMTELYKEGKIRAIGVSNFLEHHLASLMQTEVKPMVNQIKYHPGLRQEALVEYCRKNNIVVEAWSPLGSGKLMSDAALQEIAGHYGKNAGQLCIAYALQNDVLPLPKSTNPERIVTNLDVDFVISEEDMAVLNAMPELTGNVPNPDEVDF